MAKVNLLTLRTRTHDYASISHTKVLIRIRVKNPLSLVCQISKSGLVSMCINCAAGNCVSMLKTINTQSHLCPAFIVEAQFCGPQNPLFRCGVQPACCLTQFSSARGVQGERCEGGGLGATSAASVQRRRRVTRFESELAILIISCSDMLRLLIIYFD